LDDSHPSATRGTESLRPIQSPRGLQRLEPDDGPFPTTPNRAEQERPNPLFQCPSDPNSKPSVGNNNYFGVQGGGPEPDCVSLGQPNWAFYYNGIFQHNKRISIAHVRDGLSNTLLVGEQRYQLTMLQSDKYGATWASGYRTNGGPGGPWSRPNNVAGAHERINVGKGATGNMNLDTRAFGSFHPGGCHFAIADGSVHFFSETIDLGMYWSLATRNNGLPLGGFEP
jgi:hypothetical protein